MPEVDRLLALALRLHDDRIDPATGQDIYLSTHPALAEYWGVFPPAIDYAHMALSQARKRDEELDHPETRRYTVGLNVGWEDALAAWGEQSAPDQ